MEVRGIEGALQDNVRNYVGEPSSDEPLAVRRFAGGLDRRVREALQALGHYDPEIDVTTRRDGEEFLDIAPRVPVTTQVETFPLDQANEALRRLREGELHGAAVLKMDT